MLIGLLGFDARGAFDAVYGASAGAMNASYFLTGGRAHAGPRGQGGMPARAGVASLVAAASQWQSLPTMLSRFHHSLASMPVNKCQLDNADSPSFNIGNNFPPFPSRQARRRVLTFTRTTWPPATAFSRCSATGWAGTRPRWTWSFCLGRSWAAGRPWTGRPSSTGARAPAPRRAPCGGRGPAPRRGQDRPRLSEDGAFDVARDPGELSDSVPAQPLLELGLRPLIPHAAAPSPIRISDPHAAPSKRPPPPPSAPSFWPPPVPPALCPLRWSPPAWTPCGPRSSRTL
jgi:hypothetical protein